MATSGRPLVSVKALEGDMATDSAGVPMPHVFRAPSRPDVNVCLRSIVVAPALAATAVSSLVLARCHHIMSVHEFPLVVSDSSEGIEKTAQAIKVLKQLGHHGAPALHPQGKVAPTPA